MPANTSTTVSRSDESAVILERIEQIRSDVADLNRKIEAMSADVAKLKEVYYPEHVRTEIGLADLKAWRGEVSKPADHLVLKALADKVDLLIKIQVFIVISVAGLLINFFWQVLTHQATIIVP